MDGRSVVVKLSRGLLSKTSIRSLTAIDYVVYPLMNPPLGSAETRHLTHLHRIVWSHFCRLSIQRELDHYFGERYFMTTQSRVRRSNLCHPQFPDLGYADEDDDALRYRETLYGVECSSPTLLCANLFKFTGGD